MFNSKILEFVDTFHYFNLNQTKMKSVTQRERDIEKERKKEREIVRLTYTNLCKHMLTLDLTREVISYPN